MYKQIRTENKINIQTIQVKFSFYQWKIRKIVALKREYTYKQRNILKIVNDSDYLRGKIILIKNKKYAVLRNSDKERNFEKKLIL